jgi:PncC family amidohydrolase
MSAAASLVHELANKGWQLALAESCTGGMIAAELTEVSGASRVFGLGVVSYSNTMKVQVLDVPSELLERFGAVSSACVGSMLDGVQKLSEAQLCAAVSGVAGPQGGSDDKPVGMVWIGLARGVERWTESHQFSGDRAAIRRSTTDAVFAALRKLCRGDEPW